MARERKRFYLAAIFATVLVDVPFVQPETFAQRGAQSGPARANQPQPTIRTGQADAPVDLTGYWISIIADEWRYRMLTPPKGNVDYLPVNAEGRRRASEWDPAKDEAAGEACRAYGAGGIMRLPGRLHITWQGPDTLQMDIDTGTQTRRLRFGQSQPSPGEQLSWQGYSRAEWELPVGRGTPTASRSSQLKVVTTKLRPGYLRKNGVPYGRDAILTEYFVVLTDRNTQYLAVTTMLEDPQYLAQPWIRTSQFRKQPNGAGWNPTPCTAG